MKHILLPVASLTLLLAAASPAWAEPEITGKPSELSAFLDKSKPVDLFGEAEIKVPVDRAIVTLKVTSENRSLADAIGANRALRAKLVEALAAKRIPADRVTASKFSSTPTLRWIGDKVKSYKVENLVQVSVKDEAEFQAVVGVGDQLTDILFHSIESNTSDMEALRRDAMAKAIDDADKRKKIVEEKLGLKLEPRSVQELTDMPMPYANINNRKAYAPMAASATDSLLAEGYSPIPNGDAEAPGGLGEIVVRARVRVTYAAVPR
jgi:uncharacterized protein YggE